MVSSGKSLSFGIESSTLLSCTALVQIVPQRLITFFVNFAALSPTHTFFCARYVIKAWLHCNPQGKESLKLSRNSSRSNLIELKRRLQPNSLRPHLLARVHWRTYEVTNTATRANLRLRWRTILWRRATSKCWILLRRIRNGNSNTRFIEKESRCDDVPLHTRMALYCIHCVASVHGVIPS